MHNNPRFVSPQVDLVKHDQAMLQHEQIRKFVAGTVADDAPVIPISAVLKYNIDVVCEYINCKIPIPVRDFTSVPRLIIIRSFDVNKPGEEVENLRGGTYAGPKKNERGVLCVSCLCVQARSFRSKCWYLLATFSLTSPRKRRSTSGESYARMTRKTKEALFCVSCMCVRVLRSTKLHEHVPYWY